MATHKRIIILDTHAILHRAYHALPDFTSKKGEPTGALYGLVSMLVKIITDLKPDYIVAAADLAAPTHRHIVYEKYKAQRAETEEALVSQIVRSRDVLRAFGIPLYEKEGFEADDCIGTIVEDLKTRRDLDIVIASGDMDMLQLIDDDHVRVFTFKKGLSETVLYNKKSVVERFGFGPKLIADYKGLRGDPSDNIPGVKGIGEKTAQILISSFGSVEDIYKVLKKDPEKMREAGIKQGMLDKLHAGEEDALFSKELATIRTDAPIDFALPQKEWGEEVSPSALMDMLAEFDFRSLMPRVHSLLQNNSSAAGRTSGIDAEQKVWRNLPSSGGRTPEDFLSGSDPGSEIEVESVDQEALQKAAIAVWLLDSTITEPTLDDIYRMGKSEIFAEAFKNILAEIKERKLDFVYEQIELPLAPVLRKMEQRGVRIDKEFLKNLSAEYTKELKHIAGRIYTAAGGEFNPNSPKQLGEVLFDKLGLTPEKQKKTAGGQRSTRESELVKMKQLHPIIEDILSYRELQKLLSTYIDTIPALLDPNDRLHTSFIQTGTATGRLSSQNPNLQNIPIKTELGRAIRHAFVAGAHYALVSFDYSQIELRIAAFLSHDEALTEIFKTGRDVHTEVAARVFHVRDPDVTYEQRRRAKVINFGILYGMGVTALQAALGTSRKEAQEFYNQYFEAFPRLAAYIDEVKADAARRGYTETFFGRRRYFEGIKSSIQFVRASAERMAINAPMQGTQADVVKLAMIKIDELFEKEAKNKAYLLLQVHDELVFEIEEGLVETLAPKIKEIMEGVIPLKETRGIPFIAEGKMGKNWGEMKNLVL
ncbi:MAG TPA: DNA polymerase [Candidatus Paceibacterota bacterium]